MFDWWKYIAIGLQYVNILVNALMIGLFFRPFLYDKRKAKWIALSYVATMSIIFPIPWDNWAIQPTAIGIISILAVSVIIEKKNACQKIFLSITSYLLIWISGGLSLLLWNGLWSIWQKAAESPRVMTDAKMGILLNVFYVLINGIELLCIGVLMYVMVKIIHRSYTDKHRLLEKKELFLLLSPYLSIISGYYIVRFMMNAYAKDTSKYVWDSHTYFFPSMAVFQIMSFLTILAVITIYGQIKLKKDEEFGQNLLAGQVRDLKEHINEVEKLYQDIRGMKHDLNNHIQILQNLYEKGEHAQARNYLEDMKEDYSRNELDVKTGNPITDILIMQKRKDAEAANIVMTEKFIFPNHGNASAYDISIILNNVLTNAIEAAANSKEKYVDIKSRMRNDIYFIEVRNSFDGILVIDEESGIPETTKKGEGHGLGLRNVKKVVEKYFGAVSMIQEGKEVRLTVMMVVPV